MSSYPPYLFLIKCFESSPLAILTYVLLWKNTYESECTVSKKYIQKEYFTNPYDFQEHLFLLRNARLIQYSETEDCYRIELNQNQVKAKG